MSKEPPKTIKSIPFESGPVFLNLFIKKGDYGLYLEPGRIAYTYRDEQGEKQWSEYLRARHCRHAANCYAKANAFMKHWKLTMAATNNIERETDTSEGGTLSASEDQEAA